MSLLKVSRIYAIGTWDFKPFLFLFFQSSLKAFLWSMFFFLSFIIMMIGTFFNLISHSYQHNMICFRIVLGIITKKNILEHLEQLKQHVEPLVIRYIRFPHQTPQRSGGMKLVNCSVLSFPDTCPAKSYMLPIPFLSHNMPVR